MPKYAGNMFNFLTGFIFYPTAGDPRPVLDLLFRYNDGTINTGLTLNGLAFTAQFTAGILGTSSPNRSAFASPQQLQDMYAFCQNSANPQYGNCSLVTFNSLDESKDTTDWVVADTYYQVNTGACSDSFSSSKEAW